MDRLDDTASLVVGALRRRPLSRTDLVESTGWSRNTVATRLGELMDLGWVVEDRHTQGDRGRPYLRYKVNPHAALIYAGSFGWDQLSGTICGIDGAVLVSEVVPFQLGSLHDAIGAVKGQLTRLVADPVLNGRAGASVHGSTVHGPTVSAAVIGVPSPIANPVQLAAWAGSAPLGLEFSAQLEMPVLIENDANLMALGLRERFPDVDTFVFVKIATGIGAGVVINGRLHAGVAGLAGEVGHVPVRAAQGRQCACGNRGCVAEIASAPAVLRDLSTADRRVGTLDDLQALVAGGDGTAVAALRSAGRQIGEALVGVVAGIAPELLVLGGRLTQMGDHLATGVRESLTQFTLPALSSRLRVDTTTDHAVAVPRGAADLAFGRILSRPPRS